MKEGWNVFSNAHILTKKECTGQNLLELVIRKLKATLVSDDDPVIHATCRIICDLAKLYITYFYHHDDKTINNIAPANRDKHPLNKLYVSIVEILKKLSENKSSPFVRVKILQTFIWMYYVEDADELEKTILKEITTLPSELFDRIAEDLCKRVKITAEFSDATLHLFLRIFEENPSQINPDNLIDIWKTVIQLGSNGRIKVLNNIITFLDMPLKTNHTQSITYLHQIIYWFLGENTVLLTGIKFFREEKKRQLEDSDGKKKQPTHHHREKNSSRPIEPDTLDLSILEKRRLSAVVPSADNKDQEISNERPKESRKPPPINTSLIKLENGTRNPGFLTSRPSFVSEETKTEHIELDLPQGMGNPLLRTVIMRLQYSVAFGSWEVRLVCLRALGKIAFLANFEVKLHLYSFFQTICKDQSVGLAAEALPIFLTLHKIFIAFSDYVKMGTNLTASKKLELNNEIRQYCNLPPDFHPLGIYPSKKGKPKELKEIKDIDDSPRRHSVVVTSKK